MDGGNVIVQFGKAARDRIKNPLMFTVLIVVLVRHYRVVFEVLRFRNYESSTDLFEALSSAYRHKACDLLIFELLIVFLIAVSLLLLQAGFKLLAEYVDLLYANQSVRINSLNKKSSLVTEIDRLQTELDQMSREKEIALSKVSERSAHNIELEQEKTKVLGDLSEMHTIYQRDSKHIDLGKKVIASEKLSELIHQWLLSDEDGLQGRASDVLYFLAGEMSALEINRRKTSETIASKLIVRLTSIGILEFQHIEIVQTADLLLQNDLLSYRNLDRMVRISSVGLMYLTYLRGLSEKPRDSNATAKQ